MRANTERRLTSKLVDLHRVGRGSLVGLSQPRGRARRPAACRLCGLCGAGWKLISRLGGASERQPRRVLFIELVGWHSWQPQRKLIICG